MNQGWVYREQVKQTAVGQTVCQYYSQRYRHSTKAQWRTRILTGQVLLDGRCVTPQTILQAGQKLEYHRPPWTEPIVPLAFKIIYEDRDLMVIDKPAGLPVLPGGGFLEHTLWWQMQQQFPQNTPTPIHRLGRGTSGLMLLGRSPEAKSSLSQQMRANSATKRTITKVYWAIVPGNSIPDRLTINTPIGKIPHQVLGYIYGATPQGKFARSDCRVLKRDRNSTLVEVTILTGRPHQIRIHLAAAGYPLLGDSLYLPGGIPRQATIQDGDKAIVPGDCGYYLHAYSLNFSHPRTHKRIQLQSPPHHWQAK